MFDALLAALHDWQNFYLLTGTAAATLVGLQFVAVSLAISSLPTLESPTVVRAFVTPTLLHFTYVLGIAALLLVPLQFPMGISVLLAGLGVGGLWLLLPTIRHLGRLQQASELARSHWVWHLALPGASYLLLLGAASGLLVGVLASLDLLALAVVILLGVGIHNAWDLTLWIAKRRQS